MSQPYPPPAPYPVAVEPTYQVRVMKHTGAVIFWHNQRWTVTGTYAQCQAAIGDAQNHNLAAGWWSVGSLLLWNWVALSTNRRARADLQEQALWYAGTGTVAPPPPQRTSRWWLAIVIQVAVLAVPILLLGLISVVGGTHDTTVTVSGPSPTSHRGGRHRGAAPARRGR